MDKRCKNCEFWSMNEGGSVKGKCNKKPESVSKLAYDFCGEFTERIDDIN